ncbi:MAG: UDP-2,3-diacylglucosamine diphosphatase LpxI [Rhodobacteraceae bacterium]|nr:UDP-2,3-diacylglucosamine diphosphatase LpxI [Paracoccaceae bacterium]
MAELTAIIAGRGALPGLLAQSLRAAGQGVLVAGIEGFAPDDADLAFRFERLMVFIDTLLARGVTRVAFAGAIHRPRLEPEMFDPRTAALVPQLLPAIQAGDDATLRAIVALFEDEGLPVAGPAALAPDLVPGPGVLGAHAPDAGATADAARAASIVAALGAVDVGQAAVVARGLCLGVEALAGTDALLAQVAALPEALRPGRPAGLLYKAPKPGQERRIDLPAIGPATIAAAAAAGLAGVAFEAHGVLLLGRAETLAEADARGLFLWSRSP